MFSHGNCIKALINDQFLGRIENFVFFFYFGPEKNAAKKIRTNTQNEPKKINV